MNRRRAFLMFLVFWALVFVTGLHARRIIIEGGRNRTAQMGTSSRTMILMQIRGSVLGIHMNDERVTTLWLSIRSEADEPVRDLALDDITVVERVNGRDAWVPSQNISFRLRQPGDPLFIALLRDISISLDDTDLALVSTGIQEFVSRLSGKEQVELIDFGKNIYVRQRFTTDRTALSNALSIVRHRESTALYDGLQKALIDLDRDTPVGVLRLCIVFTDGEDNASTRATIDTLAQMASRLFIPIVAIGVGEARQEVLRSLAQSSRGLFFELDEIGQIPEAYRQIRKLVDGVYVLSYVSRANAGDRTKTIVDINYPSPAGRVSQTMESPELKVTR